MTEAAAGHSLELGLDCEVIDSAKVLEVNYSKNLSRQMPYSSL
jgi:hypothetical protein